MKLPQVFHQGDVTSGRLERAVLVGLAAEAAVHTGILRVGHGDAIVVPVFGRVLLFGGLLCTFNLHFAGEGVQGGGEV